MVTLAYLVAIVVVYGILADGMDRAVQRTFRARSAGSPVGLVEEFRVRPTYRARRLRHRSGRGGRPGKPGRRATSDSTTPSVFLER